MDPLFEIGVIAPDTGRFVAFREPGVTRQDLEDATFRLMVGGVEYVGEAWSLGPLERLVRQLDDVRVRLERDQVALLRSGVEDQIEVPYFLFEPDGTAVKVSGFLIPDRTVGSMFPSDVGQGAGANQERLYNYVRDHREALLGAGAPDTFREVSCPRTALLRALDSELAAAKDLWLR